MLHYIHQTPLSYCSVEGGSGDETSCLTNERTLIRASRLEFGKHFTKAPVGANDFKTVQNLLMKFLSSSKTEMKGGFSNMLQCQADVACNLE